MELDKVCCECDGSGELPHVEGGTHTCFRCRGAGYEITEEGRALLDFLKRHWGREAREE